MSQDYQEKEVNNLNTVVSWCHWEMSGSSKRFLFLRGKEYPETQRYEPWNDSTQKEHKPKRNKRDEDTLERR